MVRFLIDAELVSVFYAEISSDLMIDLPVRTLFLQYCYTLAPILGANVFKNENSFG